MSICLESPSPPPAAPPPMSAIAMPLSSGGHETHVMAPTDTTTSTPTTPITITASITNILSRSIVLTVNSSTTSSSSSLGSGISAIDGDGGGGGDSQGLAGNLFNFQPNTTLCIRTDQMLEIVEQYTNQMFWFPATTVIILVICYCLVVFLGLLGNLLIIIVIARRRELRSSKNLYILNLSVCDVIMSAVCMPFSLAKLTLKKWTLGAVMCRIIPALATVDVFVSTFTIVAIALDRYMSIMYARQMKRRLVLTMLVIIWVVSILLSTPLFCFHTIDTMEMMDHLVVQQCIDDWPDDLFREIYTTTVMLFQYLTPSTVISLLHARICSFLRDRHDDRPGCDTQIAAKAKADMKRHRKNMVLLTAMSLIFSFTWLPLTVLNIIADLEHEAFAEKQYNLLHAICLLIAMSSSALNPIMYGWYNSNIRRAFCDFVRVSGESKVSEERDPLRRPQATSTHRSGREKTKTGVEKENSEIYHSNSYESCPGRIISPSSPAPSVTGFGRERVNTLGKTPSLPRCTKMVRAVIEKTYRSDNRSFCSEEAAPSEKNDSLNGKKETDSLKREERGECAVSYDSIAMTCD